MSDFHTEVQAQKNKALMIDQMNLQDQEEEKNLLNHKVINLEEMNLEERANNELKKNEQTGRTWKS